MTHISPLEMKVITKNKTRKILAINEVSILRQSRQAANLSIKNGGRFLIKKLVVINRKKRKTRKNKRKK